MSCVASLYSSRVAGKKLDEGFRTIVAGLSSDTAIVGQWRHLLTFVIFFVAAITKLKVLAFYMEIMARFYSIASYNMSCL